jgi:hypothetical protein
MDLLSHSYGLVTIIPHNDIFDPFALYRFAKPSHSELYIFRRQPRRLTVKADIIPYPVVKERMKRGHSRFLAYSRGY